jgi:hypothetical protein
MKPVRPPGPHHVRQGLPVPKEILLGGKTLSLGKLTNLSPGRLVSNR